VAFCPRAQQWRAEFNQEAFMKAFECNKVVPNCNAVIRGKDEQEVMTKAAEHAKSAHGMQSIPDDVAKKVRSAIHEA
jgi:predicted small metal-binding protein